MFVTGGGSGIGAAIVTAFAAAGRARRVHRCRGEASEALARAAGRRGPRPRRGGASATCATSPRCRPPSPRRPARWATSRCWSTTSPATTATRWSRSRPTYYDDRMAINERPAFFAIQSVVPGMRRLGAGSIINLGSTGWQGKGAGYPCYAIAKSSVNGLTRGLAENAGPGPHPHQHRVAGLGHDRAADQAVAGRAKAKRSSSATSACRTSCSRTTSRAWCCSSPPTTRAMCTAQEFKVDAGWVLTVRRLSRRRRGSSLRAVDT